MIPETTRKALIEAMSRFDRDQRDTPEWQGWEERGTQRYALIHDGRRYPPEQIIALATGLPRTGFTDGAEANGYLQRYGFSVDALNTPEAPQVWWVNQGATYRAGRDGGFLWSPLTDPRGAALRHWTRMADVRAGDIIVHYSSGTVRALGLVNGTAYAAPQPANFDEDRPANWEERGQRLDVSYHELKHTIPLERISAKLQSLSIVDGPLNRVDGVKQGYLWRFSPDGLRVLREASDEPWPEWATAASGGTAARAWIFQASPSQWDLDGALAELAEFNWSIRTHRSEIHTGDTVFLWESGDRAGIAAVATVLTEPGDLADDADSARFDRGTPADSAPGPQVRLRVERVLSSRISRKELREHPVLKECTILRAPQGTNFPLTPAQEEGLRVLIDGQDERRIVKIAPGENARFWRECLDGGYICIGWDALGDLRSYASQDDFMTAFRIHYPEQGAISANSLWSLLRLRPGDRIVANRGKSEVTGIGEVLAPGYEWRPDRREFTHTVRVRWDTTVAGPIPVQHGWMRTIVPVSLELYAAIIGREPLMPPPPPAQPDHLVTFDILMRALEEDGLAFPQEVVSNYLLALQAKRFVILRGISGTGKTQLAMAVARAFQPRVRVSRATAIPPNALDIEVLPYMVTRNRMVLPVGFTAGLLLPQPQEPNGTRQIPVSYPAGQTTLSFWRDPDRNVTVLTFKGPFRAWFGANLAIGSRFILEAFDAPDGTSMLRFSLPTITTHEETLDNLLVTAVRPDWTDNRGLLGYYNPLLSDYARTPFLDFLLRASAEAGAAERERRLARSFFVILDEMNLARVEHYFSDFLSALESEQALHLHANEEMAQGDIGEAAAVPSELRVPDNLFFTGTVNVDETTYMFSPKVLDRAFTIEFNRVDLRTFGADPDAGTVSPEAPTSETLPSTTSPGVPTLELAHFPGTLVYDGKASMADWDRFGLLADGRPRQLVIALHDLLSEENRHFGYRVANEIARFVALAAEQAGADEPTIMAALDLALLQKVLPKFHGTQQELETLLTALFDFATYGTRRPHVATPTQIGADWRLGRAGGLSAVAAGGEATSTLALPRMATKLWGMLRRLRQQGFVSFVE